MLRNAKVANTSAAKEKDSVSVAILTVSMESLRIAIVNQMQHSLGGFNNAFMSTRLSLQPRPRQHYQKSRAALLRILGTMTCQMTRAYKPSRGAWKRVKVINILDAKENHNVFAVIRTASMACLISV